MSIKIGDGAALEVEVDPGREDIDLVLSGYGDGSFYLSMSIGRGQVRALIALLKAALPTMDKAAELQNRIDVINGSSEDEQRTLLNDQEFMNG